MKGKADFYMMRHALENPKLDWKRKLSLLWRPELVHIQEKNKMPRYKEKSKRFVIDKIVLKVPQELLYTQISEELFERDYNTIADEIRQFRTAKQRNRIGNKKP